MDGPWPIWPPSANWPDKYDSLVMIDDSHAVGVLGRQGRGTHEHHGVTDRVDIITGTLGKPWAGPAADIQRAESHRRPPPAAQPAVPVFQHTRATHCGRLAQHSRSALPSTGLRDRPRGQYAAISPGNGRSPIRHHSGRASHLSHHAGRRRAGGADGGSHAASRGSTSSASPTRSCEGQGADSRAGLGRPHRGRLQFAMDAFSAVKTELGIS